MLSRGASNPCRCCCCAAAASAGRRLLCCTAACRRRCLRVLRRAAHLPLCCCCCCCRPRALRQLARTGRRGRKMGAWGEDRGGAAGQMCSDKFQLLVGAGCARTCTSVFFYFQCDQQGTVNILLNPYSLQPSNASKQKSTSCVFGQNISEGNPEFELILQIFHWPFYLPTHFLEIHISAPMQV